MKVYIFSIFALFISISCSKSVQLSGVNKEEIRTLSPDFNAVESTSAYDIEILDGVQDGKIKLSGDSALLEIIKVEVKNKKLYISQEPGFYQSRGDKVKISFNAQNLKEIVLTGSSDITAKGVQKTNDFKVVLDGSGDIKASVSAVNTEIQLNGSGDISISGKTDHLKVNLAGSGDIHAFDLKANSVQAGLTGSGNLEVWADSNINAGVTGSGDLLYKGQPAQKDFKTPGSGEIIDKN